MEIIDCLQPSSRPGMRTSGRAGITGTSFSLKNAASLSVLRIKNAGEIFTGNIKPVLKTLTAVFKKFWWFIPCFTAAVKIPELVYSYILYDESFARNVSISSIEEFNVKELDQAMASFAVEQSLIFDSEGNLLSETGIPLRNKIDFNEKVTFRTYKVKQGESISSITKKFALKNMSTLIAVNDILNARNLRAGQRLVIPSTDGMYHTVKAGESVSSIGKKYGISETALLDVNDITTQVLSVGEKIFIPGAKLDSYSLKKAMGELFTKPLKNRYRITDVFGPRINPVTMVRGNHTGIDLACATGNQIYPAMSGKVLSTGFNNVYGNYVIVQHIDGYQTLYAHMSRILCKKGDSVSQNTVIGKVGSTGMSTGPHLHFSVYKHGKLVNPETVVKLR
ncbi:MAG: M23 family metallopeptidase [Treponema sp.]|nr:M23 family metallopeptidase [Treponema sp.]